MKRFIHVFSLFCLAILGLSLVFSCDDDEETPNPEPIGAITVDVVSPAPGSTFNSGEDIPLALSIRQDVDILSYRVLISNQETGEFVFALSEFTESGRIDIDTVMSISSVTESIMEIEVRAEDSLGNQIDEVVSTFTLNPPEGNTLTLNFDLSYDNELFIIDKEFEYPSGEQFVFTRFDVYISNVTLVKGAEETIISDIDYLRMTDTFIDEVTAAEGFKFTIAGLEDGDYDSVRFNIGLTPEQNNTTPAEYPVSHPLGASSDYWGAWESYIFASIEGRMNIDTSNPDYEQGLALHLGSNNAMRIVDMNEGISLANDIDETIDVNIDLRNLFVGQDGAIYDIITTPSTHDLIHIPMVIELSDNLKNSINK